MSDQPSDNKETGFLKLFEDGKRFTEDLLKENEKLRLLVANLRNEKRELENKYVRVDVPRLQEKTLLLEDENRQLREEIRELKSQYSEMEKENWQFAERYVDVERQNSNLINLYVAGYRLHSTLDYAEVIRTVKEIIINMIGSEDFCIFLNDESAGRLLPIAYEGEREQAQIRPAGADAVGRCVAGGEAFFGDGGSGENPQPAACIPLKVGEKVMGVIVINSLLVQKDGFQPLDHELFDLLGIHAATAIYGSHLYSLSERRHNTQAGFIEHLKKEQPDPETPSPAAQ